MVPHQQKASTIQYRVCCCLEMLPKMTITTATILDVCPTVKYEHEDGSRETEADKCKAVVDCLRSVHPITINRDAIERLLEAQHAYIIRVRVNGETIFDLEIVP